MGALLLFVVLVIAGLAAAHRLRVPTCAERLVVAAALALAVFVLVPTLAGVAGVLNAPALAGGALAAAAALVLFAWGERGAVGRGLREDAAALRGAGGLLRRPEVAFAALAALAGWLWGAAAAGTLPPRSVDDMSYHLTALFEALARGRFALPPVEYRQWVAYPLGADLLGAWPALLGGSIRWVDGVQLVTGPIAALIAAAFARTLGASRGNAVLAALALLLFPVTLRQAASAYNDVTVAAFFGLAAFGAWRAAATRASWPFLVAGIGAGLLAATKYNYLYALVLLAPLVVVPLARMKGRARAAALALLFVPAAVLPVYWYARNLVVLGNPFYPYRLGLGPLTVFASALPPDSVLVGKRSALARLLSDPGSGLDLLRRDWGVGGPDGGFGPLFFGVLVPVAVAHVVLGARRAARERALTPLAPGLALLAGLVPFLVVPEPTMDVSTRLLLAAAVPALALTGAALTRLSPAPWQRVACAGFALVAALPLVSLGGAATLDERKQLMTLAPPAAAAAGRGGADREGGGAAFSPWRAIAGGGNQIPERAADDPFGAFRSPWHYVPGAAYGVGIMAPAWDLLDALSLPRGGDARPLWVYASGSYAAGFYGTHLQNRIWNFAAAERPHLPDAIVWANPRVFRSTPPYGDAGPLVLDALDLAPEFELVYRDPYASVYLRGDLLDARGPLAERLADWYAATFPQELARARALAPRPRAGTLLAFGNVGYGLAALALRGELPVRVRLTDPANVEALARDLSHGGPVYAIVGENGAPALRAVRAGEGR